MTLASARDRDQTNPFNLSLVNSVEQYSSLLASNPDCELVELSLVTPSLLFDIRYATENNFTGKVIYSSSKSFLIRPAAHALSAIQKELAVSNLGLKVFDAYRPYSATLRFFEICPDPNYCADPSIGSMHNRGSAIDVTLVNLTTGAELSMPTHFDSFELQSWHCYEDLEENVKNNRKILRDIMVKHGFEPLPSEWWHYNFRVNLQSAQADTTVPPLFDISPEDLMSLH